MRLLFAALALIVGTMPAAAQWLDRPWPGIPRTADGKPNLTAPAPRGPDGKPDLTGIWNGPAPEAVLDPANAQPWVNELVRQRQHEYHKGRPLYQCLPSGPEADRFAGWKRILQTPDRHRHPERRPHVSRDPHGRPRAGGQPRAKLDGILGGALGGRHADRRERRIQRQDVAEPLRAVAYGGAARDESVYRRRGLRPPAGGGDLHRSGARTRSPGALRRIWRSTADTEMLESICERSSDHWTGTAADAADAAVTVAPDVLARYVGVYGGIYLGTPSAPSM